MPLTPFDYFRKKLNFRLVNLQGVVNLGQHFLRLQPLGVEVHVDDRADNLGNVSRNL